MSMSPRSARVALVLIGAVAFASLPVITGIFREASTVTGIKPAPDVPGIADGLHEELCHGLRTLAPGVCTHGDDAAPMAAAGAASNQPGEPVPSREATCFGSGSDGQRVEVLYVYGSKGAAATSSLTNNIRRWAGQVEWTVQQSASRLNGQRAVRWVTDSKCKVSVRSVRVSNAGLGDIANLIDELQDQGYSRQDRTYMLFVQSATYCGIATAPRDDSTKSNLATRSAGYARIDTPCWDAGDKGYHSIAAHELFHTLGAVQGSAAHATKAGHCTDEHDLMCYDDGGATVSTVCRDGDSSTSGAGDLNDRLLDCGGDDYFHPSPQSGSYLAKSWNTADHPRLYAPSSKSGSSSTSGSSPTSNPIGYVLDLAFD